MSVTMGRGMTRWIDMDERHPEDGQTVLIATEGGGPTVWVATFYEGDEEHHWSFITAENQNELIDELGTPKWMPLPACPFDGWHHDGHEGVRAEVDILRDAVDYLYKTNFRLHGRRWYQLLDALVQECRSLRSRGENTGG